MMKKIKIDFIDFWDIDKENNIITNTLRSKYDVTISKEPDYIFCSVFGTNHFKYKNAIKILVIGENISPNFDLYDYVIGFYDIKYDDRYLKYNMLLEEDMYKIITKRKPENNESKKFCAFVYGAMKLSKKRIEILNKLNEYKKVDCGGKLKNNIARKIGRKKIDKINFQKQYKFVIACENQQFPEYNTEKLFDAFASNAVPIYWGDPKIGEIYNERAFINCNNFNNLDELLKVVKEIDNDDEKYRKMIMEPVFNDEDFFYKQNEKLKSFLYNIFDKELRDSKKVYFSKEFYVYRFYTKYSIINFGYNLRIKLVKIKKYIMKKLEKR